MSLVTHSRETCRVVAVVRTVVRVPGTGWVVPGCTGVGQVGTRWVVYQGGYLAWPCLDYLA